MLLVRCFDAYHYFLVLRTGLCHCSGEPAPPAGPPGAQAGHKYIYTQKTAEDVDPKRGTDTRAMEWMESMNGMKMMPLAAGCVHLGLLLGCAGI
jgi:hypothetical protein